MKASEVMITDIISVGPDTTVKDIAKILLDKRISAVPVIDQSGKILGIVSEGDLLRRIEAGTERQRSWWLELLIGSDRLADEYIKSHARKASDIMTSPVIAVNEDTSLADIATLLERHRIKRVPIVRDGKAVGIVSRANILQALASRRDKVEPAKADDTAIRNNLMAQLRAEPWSSSAQVNVTVQNGVVDLWGVVPSASEKNAFRVAAEITPGVQKVNDNTVLKRFVEGV